MDSKKIAEIANKICKFSKAILNDKENETELGNAHVMAEEIFRYANNLFYNLTEDI